MSDCTFKHRVAVAPSSLEFWPAGGWTPEGNGWKKFFACRDKTIVRMAVVQPVEGGGWVFSVAEVTARRTIFVALQPNWEKATQPTQCIHAADLAACGHRYTEVAL